MSRSLCRNISSMAAASMESSDDRQSQRHGRFASRARSAPRVPPHNYEAEQALLGAILVNNRVFDQVTEFLRPEHFADPLHGRIYEAVGKLIAARPDRQPGHAQEPVRPGPGAGRDRRRAISGAARRTPSSPSSTPRITAAPIHDLYLRRAAHRSRRGRGQRAPSPRSRPHRASSRSRPPSRSSSTWPRPARPKAGFKPFTAALTEAITMAEAAYKRDGQVTGVTTGLHDLDQQAGRPAPLRPGHPGRPAVDGQDRARHQHRLQRRPGLSRGARRAGRTKVGDGAVVAFFSLEMSAEQLATRILSEQTGISSDRIRRGEVQRATISRASSRPRRSCSACRFFIDDTPGLTVPALRTRARRLKRQHGLGLIVVDYLQLMRPLGRRPQREPRAGGLGDHPRPQGARQGAGRAGARAVAALPRRRAARGQAAAALRPARIRLDRAGRRRRDVRLSARSTTTSAPSRKQREDETDEKFNERHDRWQERGERIHNVAEVIIAKQRHGPIGTVELFFDGKVTKFGNLARSALGRRFTGRPLRLAAGVRRP